MAEDPIKLFPKLSETYPHSTDTDIAYNAVKVAISSIPVLGKATAETLGQFFGPPIKQRQDEWFRTIADIIEDLKDDFSRHKARVLTMEDLQKNELFMTALVQASTIAVGTHLTEKRTMLRHALLNIACGTAPDEDEVQIFLQMIETMTPTQVRILNFLCNPYQVLQRTFSSTSISSGVALDVAIESALPELKGKRDMVKYLLLDLYNRGLSPINGQTNVIQNPAITNSGIRFLSFVLTNPLDKK